ncbi:MAG: zf-HC2 domain-containing protein [Candidatus Acidiferrales bacterium]
MEKGFKSSACPEFEALLEDHLAGELGGPDAARLSEHLHSCVGCRESLALATASTRLLAIAEPTPDPGAGFARLVMARIRAEQERAAVEKGIWLPFVSLAWRFAAAAAFAVVLLFSYDTTLHPNPQQNVAQIRGTRHRDLISDAGTPPDSRDDILMMMAETNHGKH